MTRRIRADFPDYELANARVHVARADRECCHPLCHKHGLKVWAGTDYARPSAGLEFCEIHFERGDVVEVSEDGTP